MHFKLSQGLRNRVVNRPHGQIYPYAHTNVFEMRRDLSQCNARTEKTPSKRKIERE